MPDPLDYAAPEPRPSPGYRVSDMAGVFTVLALVGAYLLGDHAFFGVWAVMIGVTAAVVAVFVAVVAGHYAGPGRPRVGMWFSYIVIALTAACVVLTPQMGRARETAKRVKCASNLRQIGLAAMLYQNEHADPPPDLQVLLHTQDITASVFVCPSTESVAAPDGLTLAPGHVDYIWLGGDFAAGNPAQVAALEPLATHDKPGYTPGANVLYADGSVTFETPATVRHLVNAAVADGRLGLRDAAVILGVR